MPLIKSGTLNRPWSTKILGQFVTRMRQLISQSYIQHIRTSPIKQWRQFWRPQHKRIYTYIIWFPFETSWNVSVVLQNICLALLRASNIYCLCKILYVDVVCFCIPVSAFLKNTTTQNTKKHCGIEANSSKYKFILSNHTEQKIA